MRQWVIANVDNPDLLWSNSEGFTEGDDFESFTDEERWSDTIDMPEDGEWMELVVVI